MLKKIALGVILFIYIILIFFSACTSLTKKQPHYQHVRKMETILDSDEFLPYQNFVFLKKYIFGKKGESGDIEYCQQSEEDCNGLTEYTTASGVVVSKNKNKLRILTVDHWCSETVFEAISLMYKAEDGEYVMPDFYLEVDFYGKQHRGKIIDLDPFNDICLLEIESEYAYKASNLSIAKNKPKLGEKVYALSAPAGVASNNIRLEFEGSWAGCDDEITKLPYCYYTIPAAPGSSGSGVFNDKGELVSLISISLNGFDQISGGPRQFFMERILSENIFNY